jgi:hypothetical protein
VPKVNKLKKFVLAYFRLLEHINLENQEVKSRLLAGPSNKI